MVETDVLLTEDDPNWRADLVKEVRRARSDDIVRVITATGLPKEYAPWKESPGQESSVRLIRVWLAESYERAQELLDGRTPWDLVVTDIGLTGDGDKFGKQIARRAKEKEIPCLVVSGSLVVGTDDVAELFREYKVYDYINKKRFDTNRFQGHVRCILGHPTQPLGPREVTIEFRDECFFLHSKEFPVFMISRKYKKLFSCFFLKVYHHAAGEEVDLPVLNDAVNDKISSKASTRLRKGISALNESLREKFGPTPDNNPWIQNSRGCGYSLNTVQLRWALHLKEISPISSHSVHAIPIDPHTMQDNTPAED